MEVHHKTQRRGVAVLAAVVLVASAGCPSPAEKGEAEAPPKVRIATGDNGAVSLGSDVAARPPEGEFQQPPIAPPVAPLPKLTPAPEDAPSLSGGPLVPVQVPAAAAERYGSQSDKPAEASSKSPKPRTGKHSGIPFDPIKENGPIFVDWPRPKAALVLTGVEHGYLEPCGCAGLDRMKGGMSRRHTMLRLLREEKGWPVVAFDVGGLARGFGRQAEMKFRTLVESKEKMGYAAVTFGTADLRLPAGELVSVAAEVNGRPSMFLSANVGLFGFDQHVTQTHRVVEAGGVKIGVTAVLGRAHQKEINNPEIEMSDPAEALQSIVPELKKAADFLVLLAHAPREEAVELARRFPEFNAVVLSDGPAEPPAQPERVEGVRPLLITVGEKGMNAIVLGLYDDPKTPWRYQRVPLDSRFPASPDMKALMAAYQEQLKSFGFAGLGLRPAANPMAETNGRFVGSKKCESCHEISYRIWKKSKHASAYATLVELDPPRQFDPECVSCHVVGWHPTKFFPYESGFESLEKTPHLINTGCEGCHGPGEKHVAAELGADEALQEKYRKAVVVTKEESKKRQCMECHDLDNSPDFDFDAYWPLVEHYESVEE